MRTSGRPDVGTSGCPHVRTSRQPWPEVTPESNTKTIGTPLQIDVPAKNFADGRDFRRRPRFSPKSEIFADARDFRRNPRFSPKSEIFAKIRDFRQNPDDRMSNVFFVFFFNFCDCRRRGGLAIAAILTVLLPPMQLWRPQKLIKQF